jgi:uncharacterized protein (TIGR02757 family)
MAIKPFSQSELQELLEEKFDLYNRNSFIETDPISIPHRFSNSADIEVAAFLTATISWGQRLTLIRNANWLLDRMDECPSEFIRSFTKKDLIPFKSFVHRTFNGQDCIFFLNALKDIIHEYGSLEQAFKTPSGDVKAGITAFRERFLGKNYPDHPAKHISNPDQNSAAKRLNMFLRWMVRKDDRKIDFGIWTVFKPNQLFCPLDVHSGGVARKLGILTRTQNDWKAVEELTESLGSFDPNDPVKYDYALFGLGVFEQFRKD